MARTYINKIECDLCGAIEEITLEESLEGVTLELATIEWQSQWVPKGKHLCPKHALALDVEVDHAIALVLRDWNMV